MKSRPLFLNFTYTLKLLCTPIIVLLLGFSAIHAEDLSEEMSNIKQNGPIVTTKKIEGKVWPEVTLKAYIASDSLTSAAVFAAFDYQKEYIPNLLQSSIVKEVVTKDSNDIHVQYVMDMPWPLSDSEYINGHRLSSPTTDTYRVEWYMVQSESADDLKGSATFSPFPGEKEATLLIYHAHVDPKSFMAGALRKFMVRDVKASINATIKETARLKENEKKLTKKYVDIFRDILSGKPAYLLKS